MNVAFKIGSDPEFFAKDKETGQLVSSIDRISGIQKKKVPCNGGFLQEDNVAFEINPIEASSFEEWRDNTNKCFSSLKTFLKESNLSLVREPMLIFPPSLLEIDGAKQIGCEPEMNAWTLNRYPVLKAEDMGLFRTSSGHISVSFDCGNDLYRRVNLVRNMDMLIGSVIAQIEPKSGRRAFYGKPGAHRSKLIRNKHAFDGIEYRVLSNYWVGREKIMKFIFNTVQFCLDNEEELVLRALTHQEKICDSILNPGGISSEWMKDFCYEANPNYRELMYGE